MYNFNTRTAQVSAVRLRRRVVIDEPRGQQVGVPGDFLVIRQSGELLIRKAAEFAAEFTPADQEAQDYLSRGD